jgi:hypothetical protein
VAEQGLDPGLVGRVVWGRPWCCRTAIAAIDGAQVNLPRAARRVPAVVATQFLLEV